MGGERALGRSFKLIFGIELPCVIRYILIFFSKERERERKIGSIILDEKEKTRRERSAVKLSLALLFTFILHARVYRVAETACCARARSFFLEAISVIVT